MTELTPETLQQQTEKMRQRLLKTTYGSSVHAASHRADELRGCFAIMDEVIAVWGAARKRIEELEKGRVGYENELSGHRAWRDHYEARIEALEIKAARWLALASPMWVGDESEGHFVYLACNQPGADDGGCKTIQHLPDCEYAAALAAEEENQCPTS